MTRSRSVLFAITFVALLPMIAASQSSSRAKLEQKIVGLMEKLRAKEAEFLSPSAEDQAAFASFLRQPDTGLTRLMPREKYDGKLLTRGGGAYYSFVRLAHEYGYGSDIELQREQFTVGFAGADFGFYVALGDVQLGSIADDQPGVDYLTGFTPPSKLSDAREQQARASNGFEINGFRYIDRVPVILDRTYVLRSINYRSGDVLVALRVVRQDTDGSVIVLWKVLKRFPVPELVN